MVSREFIEASLPELNYIKDMNLRSSCIDTWLLAAEKSGHTDETLKKVRFSEAGLVDCPITLLEHTRIVTKTALILAEQFNTSYAPLICADMDIVAAAAILHDVGKSYDHPASDPGGQIAKETKYVRHPYSGAAFARECGCPWQVCYIISNHSFEGEKAKDFPEFFIVRRADMMHFEYLFFGYEAKAGN